MKKDYYCSTCNAYHEDKGNFKRLHSFIYFICPYGHITKLGTEKITKQNKFKNIKPTIDGITFDSRKEGARYNDLKLLQKEGSISNLVLQPTFKLLNSFKYNDKTIRGISYIADFMYQQNDKTIVEDVKSSITAKNKDYIIKKKLFLYQYGHLYHFIETI